MSDDVAVHPGLVQVADASGAGIRDRSGRGRPDAEHVAGGPDTAVSDPDEHTGGAGAHQVQRRRVGGAAADDRRYLQAPQHPLEVQRLAVGQVLRRNDGAFDHQQVGLGGEQIVERPLDPARGDRQGHGGPAGAHLGHPLLDQLGSHRLTTELTNPGEHPVGGPVLERIDGGNIGQCGGRVIVTAPHALGVQHSQRAGPGHLDGALWADHTIGGIGDDRRVKAQGIDLPRRVDLRRCSRASAGLDRQVGQPVAAPGRLAHPNLQFVHLDAPRFGWDGGTNSGRRKAPTLLAAPNTALVVRSRPAPRGAAYGRSDRRSCLAIVEFISRRPCDWPR
jgi:hypothetical protein